LNISGINRIRPWSHNAGRRVLVDTDPVFTQVKNSQRGWTEAERAEHTHFLTFGQNFGFDDCLIPSDGLPWRPTTQPVDTAWWSFSRPSRAKTYTTIMQWDSYPAVCHAQNCFGMKSESMMLFSGLPSKLPHVKLQLAIGGAGRAPVTELRSQGWSVINAARATTSPWSYQRYIQRSRGEFTVAKHGYVVSNSGWFSERSANYLASGRPVITQETGFSNHIPTGEGLFAFSTLDEAVAAIETVESSYERHCKAAREIAEEYFDSRKVLTKLLDVVMSS
jgi:hypothetical protein